MKQWLIVDCIMLFVIANTFPNEIEQKINILRLKLPQSACKDFIRL